jgi:hypothetical protein
MKGRREEFGWWRRIETFLAVEEIGAMREGATVTW